MSWADLEVNLVEASATAPVTWAQRLGYLLDYIGAGAKALSLRNYVAVAARQAVPLLSSGSRTDAHRDSDWKVIVNAEVEAEL